MPPLPRKIPKLTPISPPPPPPPPLIDPATITSEIVASIETPLNLNRIPPNITPTILKRLWNHSPKALQFFNSLQTQQTTTSFDYAIDIAARARDYRTVWSLMHRMRKLNLGPTHKTIAIVAERYVSAGKPDKAVKLFLSMHHYGVQQDLNSFNTILDVLCKSKRVEKAYGLFKALRGRFKADAISYNVIANGYCLKKQMGKALDVVTEMVERGLQPTMTTYNILLKGYFRCGWIEKGWEFFSQMKKRKVGIDVISYTTVVHGLGVSGEVNRAKKAFDEMIIAGIMPSVATYNAMIQVLCKKDCIENAMTMFQEMLRKGYTPNVTTYNVVIRGLCHSGKMEEAVKYMEKMDEDCEPNIQTFNVVMRYYCEGGEIEKALDIYERINRGDKPCLPNLDTYNVLISSMFVRKKPNDMVIAGKLLIEMVERGFLPRKFTFNRVLNGLMLTGNQEFAQQILRLQSKSGRVPRRVRL